MLAVIIQVAEMRYALAAKDIVEVVPRVLLSRVPRAPDWHAGLLAYRGAPIAVIDLSRRLLGIDCPPRLGNRVLVVEHAHESSRARVGLLVEQVLEVRDVPDARLPLLPTSTSVSTSSTADHAGRVLTLAEGELLQLLDVGALLTGQDAMGLWHASPEVQGR